MNALKEILVRRIASLGPMTIAEYMAEALVHPKYGYYATQNPIGAGGDFITAPEISQMFGELIGLCLAQTWLDQGQPAQITLAELGPGRGTLMQDALRATRAVPGFHDALQVHFLEVSPTLRNEQSKRVPNAQWHSAISTIPEAPLFLIANEFFDALPIRQFERDKSGWRERVVTVDDGTLNFALSSPAPLAALNHRLDDTKPGDIVETCPTLPAISAEIGRRVSEHGGAALIFDYGDWRSQGDTLQALREHSATHPLETPGQADLTAHVDFETIAVSASPARYSLLTPQGVFLERLGITARAQQLASSLDGEALAAHIAAHRRLTHPAEMGNLFKCIALFPEGSAPPPGLEI